jgi:hypothetical protein
LWWQRPEDDDSDRQQVWREGDFHDEGQDGGALDLIAQVLVEQRDHQQQCET